MEIIGLIILYLFGSFIWRTFFAGVKSVVTGQSFDEARGHIPAMQSRMIEKNTEEDGTGLDYYAFEVKGLFPLKTTKDVTFAISLIDFSDGKEKIKPVLSTVENFQEKQSTAYFTKAAIGPISEGQGFIKWVEIGSVIPLFIQAAYSGKRNLKVIIRLLPSELVDEIKLGYEGFDLSERIWADEHDLDLDLTSKGYEESFDDTKECFALSVKLAMAVAMSDGSLDDLEGLVINKWMKKVVTPFSSENQVIIKKLLNATMKEAYSDLQKGSLSKSKITDYFNKIGDSSMKLEAMELCYDVMGADGVADDDEIKVLHRIGEALDLDVTELEKIRDLKMMDLSQSIDTDNNSLLGIDPDWSNDEVQKHLRSEFKKWNARLNNLKDKADKIHAQKMLNLIGKERKKYSG